MVGWIRYKADRGRAGPRAENLFGVEVLSIPFDPGREEEGKRSERRLRRLEQTLRRAEVSRVILPEDFPCREHLAPVRPVDPLPVYRGTADLLLLELLRRKGISPGAARGVLAGPWLCPELCACARRLCRSVREVRIDVPGEAGERFARCLQDEFGIPLIPRTVPADAVIAFGETGAHADLRLWGETGITLGLEGVELPPEVGQPVLALLWERGRVEREKLRVINLP